MRRILQTLNARGILTSVKGKGGGFALARAPEKIFLIDLIRILQGPVKVAECVFRADVCPGYRTCQLRKIMLRLQKTVVAEIKSITVASILEEAASARKKKPGGGRDAGVSRKRRAETTLKEDGAYKGR